MVKIKVRWGDAGCVGKNVFVAELAGFRRILACLKLHEIESFESLMIIFKLISIFEHVVWLTSIHETTIHLLPELWHGILKLTSHFAFSNNLLLHVLSIGMNDSGTNGVTFSRLMFVHFCFQLISIFDKFKKRCIKNKKIVKFLTNLFHGLSSFKIKYYKASLKLT